MPWEQLAIFALSIVCAMGGWITKSLWDAVQELRIDLAHLREEIGKNYMPRVEIKELFEHIIYELRSMRAELRVHERQEIHETKTLRNEVQSLRDK